MEVFIRGIPYHATERDVVNVLEPALIGIGILASSVRVFSPKQRSDRRTKLATLTLPTEEAGHQFLRRFGQAQNDGSPPVQLWVSNCKISCVRSNKTPELLLVKSLAKEQQDKKLKNSRRTQPITPSKLTKSYSISSIQCGIWSPQSTNVPIFEEYYSKKVDGKLVFKQKGAEVEFEDNELDVFDPETLGPKLRRNFGTIRINKTISILYPTVSSIIASGTKSARVLFTLARAPRMYRKIVTEGTPAPNNGFDPEMSNLINLFLQSSMSDEEEFRTERTSSLDEAHACFAPFAFVYQFYLTKVGDLNFLKQLSGKGSVPEINSRRTVIKPDVASLFVSSFRKLTEILLAEFDFPIAFQLNALCANGILPPYAILPLVPAVSELVIRFGATQAAGIMQMFVRSVTSVDPLGEIDGLSYNNLFEVLKSCIVDYERLNPHSSSADSAAEEAGMTYIYHSTITPAGCYFYGPTLEMQNRVLRKYPQDHGSFLRVFFGDEDGDQLLFEHSVAQHLIYDGQFRNYLSPSGSGIVIAGRPFQFLGFSSSSLRASSCWFMAPFIFNGVYLDAARIIENLGDFSRITCPGRCAARIGQAFSDTVGSIEVPHHSEIEIGDIERNGRCFSDGVGKISQEMLEVIWTGSEKLAKSKSTVFQIRFAGAKGVVALDTRLQGSQLCLRPSMIKFRGSTDRNIEICATPGWLPMVLNRPLIKVLEDLKVKKETFMDLQRDAINELRDSTRSAHLAANFLKRHRVAPASIKLPWMIESLHNIKLNFREDQFLERAFELALLTALRDLKHRARIPVPNGVTLIGIVDETGFLKEGEIYCPYRFDDNEEGLVEGHVLVTRSPVHHPGDVQMARAVSHIPENSPLGALKNVVVFSQHGNRDLPSKLAGGDLDGDLYNIIYDPRFSLGRVYSPAEYARVPHQDLGRSVNQNDIVDFLVDFMQNNILGLISTRHLIISDGAKDGVNHPDCLKLAEMASIAVDFPKTGIKVDKTQLPRGGRVRPDFMAPGPRVLIEKNRAIAEMEIEEEDEEDRNTEIKYYESEKVLGHLYRAIDEKKFIHEVKAELKGSGRTGAANVSDGVWQYLEENIPPVYDWTERLREAEQIKESYEKAILNLMHNFSDTPWSGNISEVEVFIGSIVGREKQTQRQKDASISMKEEFEWLVASIINSIKGDQDGQADIFGIGMACLFLCRSDGERVGPQNGLQSFAWVVTSALLTELDKHQKEMKGLKKYGR
ncbi:RNA dependent RNA polymerase-domain-containing protein [Morchella snyderi]|nr:RNA dependent RNA polymerase-domain-containing protein [Morchella snyderi]